MKNSTHKMVVIIGAGPIGLAMAVRLFLKNIPFLVLEKGPVPGWNMLDWGHIPLFTSWIESTDPITNELLKKKGFDFSSRSTCPTGKAFSEDYLSKVAQLLPQEGLIVNSEVKRVDYHHSTKTFEVVYSRDDAVMKISTQTVIDASGTWGNFNSLIPDQPSMINYIRSTIPDIEYINSLPKHSNIAVIGSGHSAMNSLLELTRYSEHTLYWLVRSERVNFGKSKVGGKSEQLEQQVSKLIQTKRIELMTGFDLASITRTKDGISLQSVHHPAAITVSHLISNVGSFPDYSFLTGISLRLDNTALTAPTLISKIDPLIHSCDTVTYTFEDTLVTDIPYYVVGMKSFGKASNFLLSKGYTILDQLMIYLDPDLQA